MIPVRNSYMLSEHLIERDAVDLPRRWAWFTFSISQFVRQAGSSVSRLRRHQLKLQRLLTRCDQRSIGIGRPDRRR
jgi:hypothetical protein